MSPKTWLALLVFSLTLLFTTSPVLADGLPVGVLSFDLLKTDVSGSLDGLDVTDYTQPGGGSSVSSFLGFSTLALHVVTAGGTTTETLTAQDALGDFSTGALFASGGVLSATLTGSFSATSVMLANGSRVNIDSGFSVALKDANGGPLQEGDFILINATSVAQGVPEPGTLVLLSLPLVVLVGRVRRSSRRLIRSRNSEKTEGR
jgi:hypothetical protein